MLLYKKLLLMSFGTTLVVYCFTCFLIRCFFWHDIFFSWNICYLFLVSSSVGNGVLYRCMTEWRICVVEPVLNVTWTTVTSLSLSLAVSLRETCTVPKIRTWHTCKKRNLPTTEKKSVFLRIAPVMVATQRVVVISHRVFGTSETSVRN